MKHASLIVLIFIAIALPVSGQLAVGYNTDGNTLAVSYNPFSRYWGEFRVNISQYNQASWSYSDRGITQEYFMIKVFNMTNACLYAGAGVGSNLLSDEEKWFSINIPAGVAVNPFSKLSNLYFTGEYNPMIVISEGVPVIHTVSLGIRFLLVKAE
jgi:hypothetical protein